MRATETVKVVAERQEGEKEKTKGARSKEDWGWRDERAKRKGGFHT